MNSCIILYRGIGGKETLDYGIYNKLPAILEMGVFIRVCIYKYIYVVEDLYMVIYLCTPC